MIPNHDPYDTILCPGLACDNDIRPYDPVEDEPQCDICQGHEHERRHGPTVMEILDADVIRPQYP